LSASKRVKFNGTLTTDKDTPKVLPKWITAAPIRDLERRASEQVAQALPTDRLARLEFMQMLLRPQKEVKRLALRSLGYIGVFDDMVAALNNPDFKNEWSDFYIDQLREAVGRDAESAAAVRAAFEKQFPDQAADLYRMLWGYSNQDLIAGQDAKLVKGLDDDLLAVRVLSSWNLKDLTGLGQLYQPDQTAARRQPWALRWRQRLDAKEIRVKSPDEKTSVPAESAAPPKSPEVPAQ
jgi:hypothetical protein